MKRWPTGLHRTGKSKAARKSKQAPFRRLRMESLEDRRLLTALVVTTASDAVVHTGESLRDAITQANDDAGKEIGIADTITFASSLNGDTITLVQGELDGGGNVTIDGAGQITINGNNDSRVFEIAETVAVTLTGLTITGGNSGDEDGGGIVIDYGSALTINQCTISNNVSDNGGGILNDGTLIVNSSTISSNTAADSGGGIDNDGALTIVDSEILNNNATAAGGGIFGSATISGSIVSHNVLTSPSSAVGAGIDAGFASLAITDSTIADNIATAASGNAALGGGIYTAGDYEISTSTISGNSVSATNELAAGAGIDFAYDSFGGIDNSTIASNVAAEVSTSAQDIGFAAGGGIYCAIGMSANNCTITGNHISNGNPNVTGYGGGVYNGESEIIDATISGNFTLGNSNVGGLYSGEAGSVLVNTIVAGNTTSASVEPRPDISNYYFADGDLIGDSPIYGDDDDAILDGVDNQIGSPLLPINPLLGSLASNGGPTQTMALQANSPAIEAGGPLATLTTAIGIDDTSIDFAALIGEDLFGSSGTIIQIDNERMLVTGNGETDGELTVVRGYGGTTPAAHNAGADIDFALDQRGAMRSGTPDIGAYQSGTAHYGSNNSIVVTTNSDASTHSGISLRDAVDVASADAINGFSDTITFAASLNGKTITLTQDDLELGNVGIGLLDNLGIGTGMITINGNNEITVSGTDDSGVFTIEAGVTATLSGLAITGGYSYDGSGGGILSDGTLTVNNCTISGNSADYLGGGIYSIGTLNLNNTTITGNSAFEEGGGIAVFGPTILMGTSIYGNTADGGAGPDVYGALDATSAGNTIGDGAGMTGITNGVNSNRVGTGGTLPPDPGFEAASASAAGWQYAPSDLPWTFTGTAGVSGNYSPITGGNPVAPQGTQVGFVQFTGSMSETVPLATGTYTLDFLAAQRENYNHGGQTLQVSVDGAVIGSITPAGANYVLYATPTFSITTAGTHTITFTGTNPLGGDNTALLDEVSVQAITAGQIADPDFSAVAIAAGTFQYTPSGSTWTFVGTAGVSANYSGITGGNPTAPQGSQVGFAQGTGSLSQAVTLSAGSYMLAFSAAQRQNYNHGGQSLQVYVDGTAVGGAITPAGTNYASYQSATFTVTAGTHTITIEGTNPQGGDNTALIDNVSIQPATTTTAGSQLVDPDFSAVNVGSGVWQYTPSGSPWTFNGTAGVSGNYSSITAGNPVAPQGSQVAFVQMTGTVSQAVSLAAGSYTLEFTAAQRQNYNHGGQSLQVLVDGTAVGSAITPTGSNYALYSTASFTVTAGTHTITIAGTNPQGGDNTALIDNVSVQTATTTTAGSQLVDPDFSAVNVGSGVWQYTPSGSPWTFAGTAGVSGNYSSITVGNPLAPQGSQVAFVQMSGTVSQAVSLAAGTYTLEFTAAQRQNYNHGGQSLQVLVDGTAVGSAITPTGSNYALYSTASFTVTAGTHTITIAGTNPQGGDNTALIDNVSVQTATTTTAGSQLVDPDFSAVNVGSGVWQYTPSGSPWTFAGTAGVSGNYSSITVGNPVAPQGSQVGFVQMTGTVSQAVSLAAGSYTLEFTAAQRENYNHGGQSLQVLVDGTAVGSAITPTGSNYALYSTASFAVTAGTHTITIAGTNPQGGDNTALIDNVSVQTATTTTTGSQLVDPDFSAVNVGSGVWQYTPSGSPWTFNGTAGVSGNYSSITVGNPLAPQGSQVAFVQMSGTVSQAVSLAAGTYTLEFTAAQRQNYNHGGQSLQVLVDGTAVGSAITPTGSNYALYSTASFTVTAGTHTITIAGTNPQGGDNTALVDAVAVQSATTTGSQLADPDFSAVDVALGNWEYTPSGSPWDFSGTAGISGNSSGITAGNPVAPQGSQVGFVQMAGSLSQVVNLAAGSYTLGFLAAQRENYNHGGQTLQVLVDGTPIGSGITPSGAAYASYSSISFTVAAGVHTIAIEGLNPQGGDNTALVDAVMLNA